MTAVKSTVLLIIIKSYNIYDEIVLKQFEEYQSSYNITFIITASVENIMLPFYSYYCEGKQYTDIVAQFENAGYTNVMAIAQKADNTKETRVNESVIAVSVNNNIIFSCAIS